MDVSSKSYFEYLKRAYLKIDRNRYYNRYLVHAKNIGENSKILDVGCGLGLILQRLKGKNAVGIDVNTYALDYAKKAAPMAQLIRGYAKNLPFTAKQFDLIFALDLIEHLKKPKSFLKEVHRVLKDYGRLVLSTPDRMSIYSIPLSKNSRNSLEQITFHVKRMFGLAFLDPTHTKEYTISELSKFLFSNGFVIERCNGFKIRFLPFHISESIIVCCRKSRRNYERN